MGVKALFAILMTFFGALTTVWAQEAEIPPLIELMSPTPTVRPVGRGFELTFTIRAEDKSKNPLETLYRIVDFAGDSISDITPLPQDPDHPGQVEQTISTPPLKPGRHQVQFYVVNSRGTMSTIVGQSIYLTPIGHAIVLEEQATR